MTLIWPFSVPLCLVLATNKPEIMNMYEKLITYLSLLSTTIELRFIYYFLHVCENNSTMPRSHID